MKLTLRELFLLVALVAMGCGWWVDRREVVRREQDALMEGGRAAVQRDSIWQAWADMAEETEGVRPPPKLCKLPGSDWHLKSTIPAYPQPKHD
jgi:hypothetical protein